MTISSQMSTLRLMATFLLLHGIPGSSRSWRAVEDLLEDAHTVLRPDLVGFGSHTAAADARGLLAPSQAEHLLRYLDEAGVDRVVLVGHDFGGPVAAHLWATAPERISALALISTNVLPDTPVPFPLSALRLPLLGGAAGRLLFSGPALAGMIVAGAGRPWRRPDVRASVGGRRQRRAIRTIFAASLRELSELYAPVEQALSTVTVPTLVAWGTRDPFFPLAQAHRTVALVPGARLVVYDGAGHFLPEERPDELARELRQLAVRASAA